MHYCYITHYRCSFPRKCYQNLSVHLLQLIQPTLCLSVTGCFSMLAMVSSPTTTGQSRAWSGWRITAGSEAARLTSTSGWTCSPEARWWEECSKRIRYTVWSGRVCSLIWSVSDYQITDGVHLLGLLVYRHWKSFGSTTSLPPSLLQAGCMKPTTTRRNSARIRTSEANIVLTLM